MADIRCTRKKKKKTTAQCVIKRRAGRFFFFFRNRRGSYCEKVFAIWKNNSLKAIDLFALRSRIVKFLMRPDIRSASSGFVAEHKMQSGFRARAHAFISVQFYPNRIHQIFVHTRRSAKKSQTYRHIGSIFLYLQIQVREEMFPPALSRASDDRYLIARLSRLGIRS